MVTVYHSPRLQRQLRADAQAAEIIYLENAVLKEWVDDFVIAHQLDDSIWIFGYGSLIWNPQLDYSRKMIIDLPRLQRKFCIYLSIAYGTKENPGLMLSIEGKKQAMCTGIADKIEREKVRQELFRYWQREMRFGNYIPVVFSYQQHNEIMRIITVIANKDSPYYVNNLNIWQQAQTIASGKGIFGNNRDYLNNLVQNLRKYNIKDSYLSKLEQAVNKKLVESMEK